MTLGVDESVEVELLDDDVPPITDEMPVQQKDNRKKLMWIALAALLLALGILAFFMLSKPSKAPAKKAVVTDTLPDPDVTIDTILPEVPVDTFDTGSAVAVPPAPGPPAANYPSSHVDVPSSDYWGGGSSYNNSYDDNNDDDNNYNRSWRPRENDDDSYDQQPEQRPEVARPAQQQQPVQYKRGLGGQYQKEKFGGGGQQPIGVAPKRDVPPPSRNSGTFHTP